MENKPLEDNYYQKEEIELPSFEGGQYEHQKRETSLKVSMGS
jgi:hypothetical protein